MAGQYQITVGVVDQATAGLKQINKNIQQMQKPFLNLQRQLNQFSKNSGLSSLRQGITKLISPIEKVGKLMLGAFGIGSIAGIIATTRQFANLSTEITRASAALGVAGSQYQKMQGSSRLLGLNSSANANMLTTLQNNRLAMRYGGDGDLQTIYHKLGLQANASTDQARDRTLDYVNEHVRRGDVDPAVLRQISQRMLGTTDYMQYDSKQFHQSEQDAKRLGRYSDDNIKKMNDVRRSFSRVQEAIGGVTQTIISKLAPKLVPLLDRFANFLSSKEGDDMINSIVKSLGELIDWLAKVDWKKWGENIKSVTEACGGLKTILLVLIGLKVAAFFIRSGKAAYDLWTTLKAIKNSKFADKIKSALAAKLPSAVPDYFKGLLGILGKVATVLGVVKTAYDLYQDSKIKNDYDRHHAYGQDIGKAAGAVIGGVVGSVAGPAGTVVGSMAGAYVGGKLGGMASDYFSTPSEKLTSQDKIARASQTVQFFQKNLGISHNQALAIAGNLSQESEFNAGARGDHGTAFGLMQWHKPRVDQIYKGTGIDVRTASFQDQLKAAQWEMQHGDTGMQQTLKAYLANPKMSLKEATNDYVKLAERPKDASGNETDLRVARAEEIQKHEINVSFSNAPTGMQVTTVTNSASGMKLNTPKITNARKPTMAGA